MTSSKSSSLCEMPGIQCQLLTSAPLCYHCLPRFRRRQCRNSFKMKILIDILVECKRIKEKVLVYSRSIPTLGKLQHLFVFHYVLVFMASVTNTVLVCTIV